MIENIKKYAYYIIGVIVLLLLTANCVNNTISKLNGTISVYEKQLENRTKNLKELKEKAKKSADSLHSDNKKKDIKITELKNDNLAISYELAKLQKDKQDALNKAKDFTYQQSAEYIAKTYNAPKSVSYTNTGVTLGDKVPNKVVETIIEKASLEKKVELTECELENTKQVVSTLEGKVENKDTEIAKNAVVAKEAEKTLKDALDLNQTKDKQISKLKKGSFITKLIAVGAFALGILIAK
jgi:uncharacterized protein (DUF3084 family)